MGSSGKVLQLLRCKAVPALLDLASLCCGSALPFLLSLASVLSAAALEAEMMRLTHDFNVPDFSSSDSVATLEKSFTEKPSAMMAR